MSKTEAKAFGGRRGRRASTPPGRGGCLLLAGCQDTEYSYDAFFNGRPNGAFSFVAMRELALLKSAATYSQWHAAIRKALPSSQYPQTPNLYGTATMRTWKVLK